MKHHNLFLISLLTISLGGCGNTSSSSSINSFKPNSNISSSENNESMKESSNSSIIDSSSSSSTHIHIYEEDITAPTCEDKGYTTYTCSCGDSYIGDEVDPLGHELHKNEELPATVSEDGHTEYYNCNFCSKYFSDEEGNNEITLESTRIKRGKYLTLDDMISDEVNITNTSGITYIDGKFINDGSSRETSLIFGQKDGNSNVVLEFDVTINEWTDQDWSMFNLHFRRWDGNTMYKLEMYSNKSISSTRSWSEELNAAIDTKIDTLNFNFNANEEYHFKVMCKGWRKTIMVNDFTLVSIDESNYTVGYFGITTWEFTKYTINNLVYRDYLLDADALEKDYPEIWSEKTPSLIVA